MHNSIFQGSIIFIKLTSFQGKQTFECGEYCQELIWKLNDALAKEKNGTPLTWPIRDAFSTDEGEEEESSGLRPETKPCVLGTHFSLRTKKGNPNLAVSITLLYT